MVERVEMYISKLRSEQTDKQKRILYMAKDGCDVKMSEKRIAATYIHIIHNINNMNSSKSGFDRCMAC